MAAFGPACVKTQKRPHVVSPELDWISGEVGLRWKGAISSEASQMLDSLQLILTSIVAFFLTCCDVFTRPGSKGVITIPLAP